MSKVLRGKCRKYFFKQHLATEVKILNNAINMPTTVNDLDFISLVSQKVSLPHFQGCWHKSPGSDTEHFIHSTTG